MVSLMLGLGLYIRLGLWLGLGLTIPKASTLTINRNPQVALGEISGPEKNTRPRRSSPVVSSSAPFA